MLLFWLEAGLATLLFSEEGPDEGRVTLLFSDEDGFATLLFSEEEGFATLLFSDEEGLATLLPSDDFEAELLLPELLRTVSREFWVLLLCDVEADDLLSVGLEASLLRLVAWFSFTDEDLLVVPLLRLEFLVACTLAYILSPSALVSGLE
jgi:hypothetical protein